MSRRIKISFVPVAIAWIIIFIHGAIPHNHQQEHSGDCKSVYHCCHDSDHTGSPNITSLSHFDESHTTDHHHFICHFSTGPFHSLDNDSPFIAGSQPTFGSVTGHTSDINISYSGPAIITRQESPQNHRGPPQLMG